MMDKPELNGDPLLPIPDVARFLGGVSIYTVNAWLSQGRILRSKLGARTFVKLSECKRFIADEGRAPENVVSK